MKEYWNFLKVRKKYWLLPIIMIAIIALAGFIIIRHEFIVIPIGYITF